MFFLFLILLIVFLANKESVRRARLDRDLAALRREKTEAALAARRAQARIDQIEAARALPAAGRAQVVIDGTRISVSGPVQVVVKGHPVSGVTPADAQTTVCLASENEGCRDCGSSAGGWVQF